MRLYAQLIFYGVYLHRLVHIVEILQLLTSSMLPEPLILQGSKERFCNGCCVYHLEISERPTYKVGNLNWFKGWFKGLILYRDIGVDYCKIKYLYGKASWCSFSHKYKGKIAIVLLLKFANRNKTHS